MRKRLLTALAVLVVVAMALVGFGYALPDTHHAESTVLLRVPPDSVWLLVRDLGSYGEWWADIERVEPGGAPGRWIQVDRHGQRLPVVVEEEVPPSRLVTRIDDAGLPFGGTWTYTIVATSTGCRLTVEEQGRISNPVFRLMARFVLGYYGTLDSFLDAVGSRFGESVTHQHGA